MTRDAAIARARAWFDEGGFEEALARLVAIPTESQKPEGLPHCADYLALQIAPLLASMEFATRILDNPAPGAGPVLIAERIEGAGLPTILTYGHGDVIRGQADGWTKGAGPWRTAREGDRLYGRGTADNKGQHLINLAALRAVLETRGALGFNVKVLVETGEETGSRGLRELIEADRAAFAADALIASDGPRVRADRPTISLGARGAVNFDLVVDLRPGGGRHSGNWGGALADPAIILAHAIACIAGPTGRVEVPKWRPEPPAPLTRALLEGVELDAGDAPGPEGWWGEPA